MLKRQTETLIHLSQRIIEKDAQISQLDQEKVALLRFESLLEKREEIFSFAAQVAGAPTSVEKEAIPLLQSMPELEADLHYKEHQIAQMEAELEAEEAYGVDLDKYLQAPLELRSFIQSQHGVKSDGRAALGKYFQEQKALLQLIKNKFAVLLNRHATGDAGAAATLRTLCQQTVQAMEVS